MSHTVSNWIHLYGNDKSLKEWSRIQEALTQKHNSTEPFTRADFLAVLKSPSGPDVNNSQLNWPKWVSYEFNSPELLSFISPNWPVSEIQDYLTMQLKCFDSQAITILEWQNWPLSCGARIAFIDGEKLKAFEAVESQNEEELRLNYVDRYNAFSEEEASTAYMWDAIARCNQVALSAAVKAGCWVTPATFNP